MDRCQVYMPVAFDFKPRGLTTGCADSDLGKHAGEPLRVCSTTVADGTVVMVSGEVDYAPDLRSW